ncbi:MAG: UDP-glucose 4-epimerase [Candidatus Latescibacterota bacterium]
MKVFLTGNKGRIGSVVERQLLEAGHEVVGFDIETGGDILDAAAVMQAMEGCDSVAHLAMVMGRDKARDLVFASGTVGTWNVLDAAETHGIRRVVSYSSVNAMGLFMGEAEPDYLPFDEEHPCRPGRPYGMAKYLGEEICRLFTERTGIATLCIRPPAVLTDERIASLRAAREENEENEWTPIWEYGCYIHIEDLASATVCALTCKDPGHQVLLVVAEDISSRDLTSRQLAQKLLPHIEWRGGEQYESEPYRALVDGRRARQVLGWKPQYRWRD